MRQIVAICCFCERVRDDIEAQPGQGQWQEFKTYMARYVLKPDQVMFSHTYCPTCLSYYRAFLGGAAGVTERSETEGGK